MHKPSFLRKRRQNPCYIVTPISYVKASSTLLFSLFCFCSFLSLCFSFSFFVVHNIKLHNKNIYISIMMLWLHSHNFWKANRQFSGICHSFIASAVPILGTTCQMMWPMLAINTLPKILSVSEMRFSNSKYLLNIIKNY